MIQKYDTTLFFVTNENKKLASSNLQKVGIEHFFAQKYPPSLNLYFSESVGNFLQK